MEIAPYRPFAARRSLHPTCHFESIDLLPTVPSLLMQLVSSTLIRTEDWDRLSQEEREELQCYEHTGALLERLEKLRLLTPYQAMRVKAGGMTELIFGNYRILEHIGSGGMGIVYKAEHIELGRTVAIKFVSVADQRNSVLMRRFIAEMRAVAQLHHPNIVTAMDAGRVPSLHSSGREDRYFVMEYLAGSDLEQIVLNNGPLPIIEACDYIQQTASALVEAHQHRLIHRDIKPSNIFITPEGRAKLLDFGLAMNWNRRVTPPGVLIGTLDFMAPEQAIDAGAVDGRADIYGLGGTLYWCLTGKTPFPDQENIAAHVTQRLTEPPPSIRGHRPELPQELEAIVMRMLARHPEEASPRPAK